VRRADLKPRSLKGAHTDKVMRKGENLRDRNDSIRERYKELHAENSRREEKWKEADLAAEFGLSTRRIRDIVEPAKQKLKRPS
jgi:hypothetical protein